jgi:hypothetical protein
MISALFIVPYDSIKSEIVGKKNSEPSKNCTACNYGHFIQKMSEIDDQCYDIGISFITMLVVLLICSNVSRMASL